MPVFAQRMNIDGRIFKHIQPEIHVLAKNAPIFNIVGLQSDSWAHKLKHTVVNLKIAFWNQKCARFRTTHKRQLPHIQTYST